MLVSSTPSFVKVHQRWAWCGRFAWIYSATTIHWYELMLLQNLTVLNTHVTGSVLFSSFTFWQHECWHSHKSLLTMSPHCIACILQENIIFKALLNMHDPAPPATQKERASLFTRTSTVTVPWREHSYEMPHWIWALCWDTGVARLCGN